MAVNWRRRQGRDWRRAHGARRLLWRVRSFVRSILLAVGIGAVALTALSWMAPGPQAPSFFSAKQQPDPDAYYRNCDAARAAGAAPLHVWEPGYRPELDADSDGVACEVWR